MSTAALSWAFEQNIRRSSAKLLLMALGNFADEDYISYPYFESLEEKCSCSRARIKSAAQYLIKARYIVELESDYIPLQHDEGQPCYLLLSNEFNLRRVRR